MCSRVMHLVMSVCVYVLCGQKMNVWGLTASKSLVDAIYCLLIEFNHQKRSLLHQMICSGKEIRRHPINETGKGFPENCIMVSRALSTCNAASYAMLLQLQCRPTISLWVQSVLTVLSAHIGYVFCGSLLKLSISVVQTWLYPDLGSITQKSNSYNYYYF